MKGRVMRNIEGTIRTVECGNGVFELVKDIDVLTITPERKRKDTRVITVGTLAIFIAAAVALIVMAPAFGVMLMAIVAWCGFAAAATGKEEA